MSKQTKVLNCFLTKIFTWRQITAINKIWRIFCLVTIGALLIRSIHLIRVLSNYWTGDSFLFHSVFMIYSVPNRVQLYRQATSFQMLKINSTVTKLMSFSIVNVKFLISIRWNPTRNTFIRNLALYIDWSKRTGSKLRTRLNLIIVSKT